MAEKASLEQVEHLAAQLPVREQLKLVASTSQRLSELVPPETVEECERQEYARRVEEFLRLCDEKAAKTIGEVDSVEVLREIRDERMSQL